jgi:ABC-2 type transport system ATP-binding protein
VARRHRRLPAVQSATFTEGAAAGPTPPRPLTARAILKIEASHGNDALLQVLHYCNEANVDILSLDLLEPNLETVFLNLTGKSLRD